MGGLGGKAPLFNYGLSPLGPFPQLARGLPGGAEAPRTNILYLSIDRESMGGGGHTPAGGPASPSSSYYYFLTSLLPPFLYPIFLLLLLSLLLYPFSLLISPPSSQSKSFLFLISRPPHWPKSLISSCLINSPRYCRASLDGPSYDNHLGSDKT